MNLQQTGRRPELPAWIHPVDVLQENSAPFITDLHTPLAQELEKLKEDSGKGRVPAHPSPPSEVSWHINDLCDLQPHLGPCPALASVETSRLLPHFFPLGSHAQYLSVAQLGNLQERELWRSS